MSSTKSVLITGDESGTGLEMAVFLRLRTRIDCLTKSPTFQGPCFW